MRALARASARRRPETPRLRRSPEARPSGPAARRGGCACGGGCPRCRGGGALFLSERPAGSKENAEAAPSVEIAPDGEATLVEGFRIDTLLCDCDAKMERAIDWARTMREIFEACGSEPGVETADDALACKTRKLGERGLESEPAGSTDPSGHVSLEPEGGLCGDLLAHGTALHEAAHKGRIERRLARDKGGKVDAEDFVASEIEAYGREHRFLKAALEALRGRCNKAGTAVTNPDYYREACAELGFELGLDWAQTSTYSRRDLHNRFPGLKANCWWYLTSTEDGSYNCYGYSLAAGRRGMGNIDPHIDQVEVNPGKTNVERAQSYFDRKGYSYSPQDGEIAYFSEGHVAFKSQHRFQGRQLWESKLGVGPLILHELEHLEGGKYGDVVAFFTPKPGWTLEQALSED